MGDDGWPDPITVLPIALSEAARLRGVVNISTARMGGRFGRLDNGMVVEGYGVGGVGGVVGGVVCCHVSARIKVYKCIIRGRDITVSAETPPRWNLFRSSLPFLDVCARYGAALMLSSLVLLRSL